MDRRLAEVEDVDSAARCKCRAAASRAVRAAGVVLHQYYPAGRELVYVVVLVPARRRRGREQGQRRATMRRWAL